MDSTDMEETLQKLKEILEYLSQQGGRQVLKTPSSDDISNGLSYKIHTKFINNRDGQTIVQK